MYEPPNRGGKTWTALGRVSGGGNDPGDHHGPDDTRELVPDAAGLHDGLERVGTVGAPCQPRTNLTQVVALPIAKNPDGSAITGPAYEYIVRRELGRLSYPPADARTRPRPS